MKILLPIILLLIGCNNFSAKKYADKTHYLVDSLNLKSLSSSDKNLIDSLLLKYHENSDDTLKLFYLNLLVSDCQDDIWLKYNYLMQKKSNEVIKKHNKNEQIVITAKKYLASSFNNLGFHYYNIDNINKATYNFNKSKEISEEIKNLPVISISLNNLGFIYKQQGDILKALNYYHQSLKINKQLNDEKDIALALNNIGGLYYNQKEYEKAIKYYVDALILEKRSGSKKGVARLYSNLGSIYKEQNKNKQAIDYFNQSIKIYTEIGDKKGLATSLSKRASIDLSMIDDFIGDKTKQLNNILLKHKSAYKIYEEIKDNEGRAFSLCNIGETYKLLNDYSSAYQYANKSLLIAKEIGFPESIKKAAKILHEISFLKNDYKNAYAMQMLYYNMQDSISNQSIKDATIQKQYEYEYEKRTFKDSVATAESQKIKNLEFNQKIQKQKTYTYVFILGSILMVLVLIIILRGYQLKKRSNLELEKKNKVIEEKNIEITDSINYAKRIQKAIIPPSEEINEHLKNCFVIYKPKDIVAGDFYWLQKVGSEIIYAAADCTGHGVPGAMVSVVCHNALNRAVREYNLIKPSEILNKTREIVIETFQRSRENTSIIKDGMDIALCAIDFDSNTLQYSGANNPLYIIRNKEIIELKADRQPVGKFHDEKSFNNNKISIEKNDIIYIFSDGYVDQFGGPRGKKFMKKQFKDLLLSIENESMNKQKEILVNNFNKWKGDLEQVDDVCIIGVRI